jgi:hypothetical protein
MILKSRRFCVSKRIKPGALVRGLDQGHLNARHRRTAWQLGHVHAQSPVTGPNHHASSWFEMENNQI